MNRRSGNRFDFARGALGKHVVQSSSGESVDEACDGGTLWWPTDANQGLDSEHVVSAPSEFTDCEVPVEPRKNSRFNNGAAIAEHFIPRAHDSCGSDSSSRCDCGRPLVHIMGSSCCTGSCWPPVVTPDDLQVSVGCGFVEQWCGARHCRSVALDLWRKSRYWVS